MHTPPFSPKSFNTFGDLLKYLRRRERLTQLELSIKVGYSEAQIGRLEKNQRRPDLTALMALFIPALHLEDEPELTARILELAETARQEDAPAPGIAPYRGLLYFDESDADMFFGRETLTARLVDRVTDLGMDSSSRFLAVVGASGSGKSSLVRAGLAVALKNAGWDTHIFTPTTEPMKILESHLNSRHPKTNSEHVLLLVDQFEETFTLCRDESERIAFVEKLLSLTKNRPSKMGAGNITVVIALRADFYSHCAQYSLLREAVAAEQEYIGQMTSGELRRAIEEPARRGGWEFEHGLVDMLLQDIGVKGADQPEPGALPLLSHALLATWEHRRGRTFTLEGYQASGGVRGAIAETAESVFTDHLDRTQQELARDVFLRLTELGEGTEDTRRRATLNELVHQSSEAVPLRTVLNTLAEARLITLAEDTAEVAHEALIREWQRLHEWLMQDREGLRLHRRLTESAREWEARGRDESELYRGARLAQAREWAAVNDERMNESEREFLNASTEQEHHDALEREAQRQHELETAQKLAETERRTARQLRRRALFLSAAFVLTIALTGVAFTLSRQAEQNAQNARAEAIARTTVEAQAITEREMAEEQASLATSRELASASVSNLEVDPERSILLVLEALSVAHTREAEEALHQAMLTSRVEMTLRGHEGVVGVAVYSPDGMRIATAGEDGEIKLWSAESGENILTLSGHEGPVYEVIFTPSGKLIASASEDGTARIWDAETGRMIMTLEHQVPIVGLSFNPDEKQLATGGVDGSAILWNFETGEQLQNFHGHDDVVTSIAFTPDGNQLVTAAYDAKLIFWNIESGEVMSEWEGEFGEMTFSNDGEQMMSGFSEGAKIVDTVSGKEFVKTGGHTNVVFTSTINKNWTRLATGGLDRKVIVSDAETGKALFTLPGHTGEILDVHFSPDGNHLVSASTDGTARVWNVGITGEATTIATMEGHGRVSISPDGSTVAAGEQESVKVWDVVTGNERFSFQVPAFATGVAFDPSGVRLAGATESGDVMIWNLTSGETELSFKASDEIIMFLAFSPDGNNLATASRDGAEVWDTNFGRLIRGFPGVEALSVCFSPSGDHVLVTGTDNRAVVWDMKSGENVLAVNHDDIIWGCAYSPDKKLFSTASRDGTARIWESSTGKELHALVGHTSTVTAVFFSPDGKELATSSRDGTTKLWDVDSGEQLLNLYGDGEGVNGVAISPDGEFLVNASSFSLHIYLMDLDDLVAAARLRVTRSLTMEECQKYLHIDQCL